MGKRPVAAALAVTAAFMLLRAGLAAAGGSIMRPCAEIPECAAGALSAESRAELQPDMHAWLRRDLAKTPLRLGALIACLLVMRPAGFRAWGWAAPAAGAGVLLAAAASGGHALSYWGGDSGWFSPREQWLGVLATVPVALWEEACYRGLLYRGLREDRSPLAAALLSTAAFTFMHWGAIPVRGWPLIFLTGFAFCGAAELGAGLPALAAGHLFIDGIWFWANNGDGRAFGRLSTPAMLACCAWAACALRARPGGGRSPSRPESTAPAT